MGVPFSCRCGAITGTVAPTAFQRGTHITCRCADCRAACKHITGERPEHVDLLLASPGDYIYHTGSEHLRVLHMTPRGVHRVYAACCGVPMNTVAPARGLAFASIYVDRLADPAQAGPLRAEVYDARSGTVKHKGMSRVVYGVVSRAIATRLDGSWKTGPFFADTGDLALPVDLISREDKLKAYR